MGKRSKKTCLRIRPETILFSEADLTFEPAKTHLTLHRPQAGYVRAMRRDEW